MAPVVLSAVPTDIDLRAEYLRAVALIVPDDHPDMEAIDKSLGYLHAHIVEQRNLPIADTRGTGRLGDQPLQRGSGRLGDQPIAKAAAKGGAK